MQRFVFYITRNMSEIGIADNYCIHMCSSCPKCMFVEVANFNLSVAACSGFDFALVGSLYALYCFRVATSVSHDVSSTRLYVSDSDMSIMR